MPVGFGFSISDFISALELVGTVIDALQDSGEVSKEYRELLRQLYAPETALLQVKRLEVDDTQTRELVALKQVAIKYQSTIDAFWKKSQNYDPPLRGHDASRIKDKWLRIKWAVYHKDDIRKFKVDLAGHTEAILLLLSTIQMNNITLHDRKQAGLAGRIQYYYFQCMAKLQAICMDISTGLDQGRQLLVLTTNALRTNFQIFQAVMQIQDIVTRIPGQVERQQPIYPVDAMGKASPFHLELIQCAETFKSVLAQNFKEVGAALKIEAEEFVLEDVATKKDIDLSREWENCFIPGQRVEMSMIFFQHEREQGDSCPGCGRNPAYSLCLDVDVNW